MKIIETFLLGKQNNPLTCEDGLVIGKELIAVIDGVTSSGKVMYDGKKGGCYAKDLLVEFLAGDDAAGLPKEELLNELNRVIREAVRKHPQNPASFEYPRANVIIYNNIYHEIWKYGDCQCSINGEVFSQEKEIDTIHGKLRAMWLETELLLGKSMEEIRANDVGRKFIQDSLVRQRLLENRKVPMGFPVINGTEIESSFIQTLAVKEGDEIVLATDGYPDLKGTLAESENALAGILEADPLCFRTNISTKGIQGNDISYDDRCYCRFVV